MNDIPTRIKNLELSLLEPGVRSSKDALDALLADDFTEEGTSGSFYTKQDILERLPSTTDEVTYTVKNFNVEIISESEVITTFTTERIINKNYKVTSLRTSHWRKTGDSWQMFYHKGVKIC